MYESDPPEPEANDDSKSEPGSLVANYSSCEEGEKSPGFPLTDVNDLLEQDSEVTTVKKNTEILQLEDSDDDVGDVAMVPPLFAAKKGPKEPAREEFDDDGSSSGTGTDDDESDGEESGEQKPETEHNVDEEEDEKMPSIEAGADAEDENVVAVSMDIPGSV